MKWGSWIAAGALGLAVLAGCGDGGDDEAEAEIRDVLEIVLTTADPEQCGLFTPNAFEQLAPDVARSKDPSKACAEAISDAASAKSIEISEVEVDGSEATATVTPDGGTYAGATVTIGLVEDDGWKLDAVTGLEIEDREAYLASYAENAVGVSFVDAEEGRCLSGEIEANATDEDLERAVVAGEKGFLYDAVVTCLGGGVDLIAIVDIVEGELKKEGIPKGQATCLAGASIAGLKGATFEQFAEDPAVEERIAKTLKDAAFFCAAA
jgi:hypothetical protein